MKKDNKLIFEREFDFNKLNTICYIYQDGIKIQVNLARDKNIISLSFMHKGIRYISHQIQCNSKADYISFDLERIVFDGITISEVERKNLAKCIDYMFDAVTDF